MAASKGIGRNIQVGVAKETTRGTAIASAAYWNPWMDLTLDEKKEFVTDAQAYGVIEDSVNLTQVKKWAQGTISGNVSDQTFGLFLLSIFGTLTSHGAHGAEAAVYDNLFNVQESALHQSLTFFLHDPLSAADYSYANGVVEKLELNFALKKFIEFTASIKAQSGASQSTFTPSTTTENRFVAQYLNAYFSPQYAGLEPVITATGTASSTIHVTALSISTDKIKVGMTVVGANIPAGTTVATIVSDTAFDLSQATTSAGSDFTFSTLVATGTASSTIHVTALTGITTAKLRVGMTVTGANIPAGATIVTIVSTTAFYLSAASTGAVSNLSFGPAPVALKSAKLTINSNVEDQEVLGNVAPADFLNKEFAVEGTFECIWQNETDAKTAFMGPTTQSLRFDIKNTDVTIGTHANPELYFDMPKVTFTELGRSFKVKDLVYQTIKWRAVYSLTDTFMLRATLVNTVNGY